MHPKRGARVGHFERRTPAHKVVLHVDNAKGRGAKAQGVGVHACTCVRAYALVVTADSRARSWGHAKSSAGSAGMMPLGFTRTLL